MALSGAQRVNAINAVAVAWSSSSSTRSLMLGDGTLLAMVNVRVGTLAALKNSTNDDVTNVTAVRAHGTYLAAFATGVRAMLAAMTDLTANHHVVALDGFMATIETQATALASA